MHVQPHQDSSQIASLSGQPGTKPAIFSWFILLPTVLLSTVTIESAQGQQDPAKKKQTVSLVIDYGDQSQKHFTGIAWTREMTILNLLQAATKHPRGIRFDYRGKGKTAFLNSIDKLKNQGNDQNWVYRVNGKLGDRSFAVFTIQPADTILWKFGKYRYNP